MNALTFPWISGSFTLSKSSSKFQFSRSTPPPLSSLSSSRSRLYCKYEISTPSDLKFVLHHALDSSGLDTTHAQAARNGFCSEIKKLSDIERETSISINRGVDLGRAALYIAAEDDSLVSHSSVPLPVEDFIERLDDLSMGYCSHYASSLRYSPENFLECLERYLYIDKGFRRTSARNQVQQRALYLHSVLTHRSGSASLLSLLYSEMLKLLRMWGLLDFDVEIFFPRDSHSSPRGYLKQKSRESDQSHIMTSQSLLVEMLKDLKNAFWPFQHDHTLSPFLRAALAANHLDGSSNIEESNWKLASAKAAQHRLQRGVWTSVHFGDMRRALSACERLILLGTDPKDLRDYSILLYHCGFYKESMQYLKLYQDIQRVSTEEQSSRPLNNVEKDAVENLMNRLNLILMEDGWSRSIENRNMLFNNSEPW